MVGGARDGRGGGGYAPAGGSRRARLVLQSDGFDDPDFPEAHDLIRAYDVPAAVRRRDGIPIPFEQDDAGLHAHFKHGAPS